MGAGQVANRYAKAWLSAAKDKKAVDAVSADCESLLAMARNSSDFVSFLQSPLLSTAVQGRTIAAVAKAAKLHEVTVSMLSTLSDNRRLAALVSVLEAAKAMLDLASGTTKAQVTSATILDELKISDIRAQLKKRMGHDVVVETKVDPSIIGGLVIRVGSTLIDDSVKTKLDRMARRLSGQNAA